MMNPLKQILTQDGFGAFEALKAPEKSEFIFQIRYRDIDGDIYDSTIAVEGYSEGDAEDSISDKFEAQNPGCYITDVLSLIEVR